MGSEKTKQIIVELVERLSGKRVVLSADLDVESLNVRDIDAIASRLLEEYSDEGGVRIITNAELARTIDSIKGDKIPVPIEVSRPSEYAPVASDIEVEYSIREYDIGFAEGSVSSFVGYFNDRLDRIKKLIEGSRSLSQTLRDISGMKNYNDGKEICIIGMVRDKHITRNNNMMVEVEDSTGNARVIFMNRRMGISGNLYDDATSLVYDEVIAVKGKIAGELLIANQLIWPDVPIKRPKTTEDDIAIAFVSDMHAGSKNFMEKNFRNMIGWLSGNVDKDRKIAEKVKYLVIGGDVADGIGVYPGQDRYLAVTDMQAQYQMISNYIEAIPDYIHIFMLPGNHDSVQRAEPQPRFPEELVNINGGNVHLVQNPTYMTLHGIDILAYHGTSLDSIIRNIPGNSYSKPEKAMVEILKRRHLSPIYGGNIILPSKRDNMVINEIPDVLNMGHIHKIGLTNYHGVDVVNSGTWQSITDLQIRQGHIPTPCIMPVLETKPYRFSFVDFSG